MRGAFRNITLRARRFGRAESAAAVVEFALILPLMLFLYFGSIEAATLFTADKRVNSVSATIGDLVSQWSPGEGKMPTTTLDDYMAAAETIIMPFSESGLRIVVSLVQVRSDGTTRVLWSRANAGTARNEGDAFAGLTGTMNQIARGGCVVAAEASYSMTPLLAQVFQNPIVLSHANVFVPRFGSAQPINLQTTGLGDGACVGG